MPKYGGGGEKCVKCSKTVYQTELVTYDKQNFHTDCFRCETCNSKVTLQKVAMLKGRLFCKPCFKKSFAESGGKYSVFDGNASSAPKAAAAPAAAAAPKKEQARNPDQASTRAMFEKKAEAAPKKAVGSSGPKKTFRFGGGAPKCCKCAKSVYETEKVEYDKQVFHKTCFKCQICNFSVSLNKVAMLNGDLFCKPCFKKTFAESGGKYTAFAKAGGNTGNSSSKPAAKPAAAEPAAAPAAEPEPAAAAAEPEPAAAAAEPEPEPEPAGPTAAEKAAAEVAAAQEKAAEQARIEAEAERAAAEKEKAERAEKKAAQDKAEAEAAAADAAKRAESAPTYSGPEKDLQGAWDDLLDEKSDINFTVFGFPNGGKKLAHLASGTDGVNGMSAWFQDNEAFFAALKVFGVDDGENVTSKRAKYVSVTFVGEKLRGIKRMKVLQTRPQVDAVFRGCANNMQFSQVENVTAVAVSKELLASGGAHKPTYYDFGDSKVMVSDLDDE